jgi:hypothetical protein
MCLQQESEDVAVFEGLADEVVYDPINRVVSVVGRDYSSVMINSSYQGSYYNQTASEVATQISSRHGFVSSIAPTSMMIGTFRSDNYSQIMLNTHSRITNEWDLLCHLAASEKFELFVDGTALVFAPLESLKRNFLTIGDSDIKRMRFHRRCPLADQTRITVKSWNSWLNQMLSHTDSQASGTIGDTAPGLTSDLGIEIAVVRPNLMPNDTEQLVQRCLNRLNEKVLSVDLVLPGDLSLKPRDVLTIRGNGENFDADYNVQSVRRHLSATEGFIEYVHGSAAASAGWLTPGGEDP